MFTNIVPAIQENMLASLVQRYMTDIFHQMNPLDEWQREETAENLQPNKQVYTSQKNISRKFDIINTGIAL